MARRTPKLAPRDAAISIVKQLRAQGHVAYLAGGCVRDELLGIEPKDFDIATDARPDRIEDIFTRTASVGAAFGVMLVRDFGPTVEVATFRADGPYSDKRRPDAVCFGGPEADAHRRDFTINALFIDPLVDADDDNRIIDFVNGQADLKNRLLRAVGDPALRLAEDHLRALRAVRFAARYDLTIDPATADAIRAHAAQLAGVSRERIGDEVRRMLAHESRAAAVRLLHAFGLDDAILGDPRPDAEPTTLAALGEWAQPPAVLAAWAIDRGFDPGRGDIAGLVNAWRRALMLSNQERDDLDTVLSLLRTIRRQWSELPVAAQKRSAARELFDQALCLEAILDPDRAAVVRAQVDELRDSPTGLAPDPLLTGEDLIALGIAPSPAFGRILDRIYDAQLEGTVLDRTAAEALATSLSPSSRP